MEDDDSVENSWLHAEFALDFVQLGEHVAKCGPEGAILLPRVFHERVHFVRTTVGLLHLIALLDLIEHFTDWLQVITQSSSQLLNSILRTEMPIQPQESWDL